MARKSHFRRSWTERLNFAFTQIAVVVAAVIGLWSTRAASQPHTYASISEAEAKAEQGDPLAQAWLGMRYKNGDNVPRDYEKAVLWLKKASEQGHIHAIVVLAGMHFLGEGVPRDHAESARLFRTAAEKGDAFSQGQLGDMFLKGRGVQQDFTEAFMWMHIADASGRPVEPRWRQKFVGKLSAEDIESAQARASKRLASLPKPRMEPVRESTHPEGVDYSSVQVERRSAGAYSATYEFSTTEANSMVGAVRKDLGGAVQISVGETGLSLLFFNRNSPENKNKKYKGLFPGQGSIEVPQSEAEELSRLLSKFVEWNNLSEQEGLTNVNKRIGEVANYSFTYSRTADSVGYCSINKKTTDYKVFSESMITVFPPAAIAALKLLSMRGDLQTEVTAVNEGNQEMQKRADQLLQ